jgi:DNA mismatch endonuclease Vsr
MPDNRTKEQRSYNMSRTRSKDTKSEIIVRKFLYANGFRFRLHSKLLPAKPDITVFHPLLLVSERLSTNLRNAISTSPE